MRLVARVRHSVVGCMYAPQGPVTGREIPLLRFFHPPYSQRPTTSPAQRELSTWWNCEEDFWELKDRFVSSGHELSR